VGRSIIVSPVDVVEGDGDKLTCVVISADVVIKVVSSGTIAVIVAAVVITIASSGIVVVVNGGISTTDVEGDGIVPTVLDDLHGTTYVISRW